MICALPSTPIPSADSATPPGSSALDPSLVREAGLTDRQRQCVELVTLKGFSYRVAADSLGIGRSTVREHVQVGLRRLERVMR